MTDYEDRLVAMLNRLSENKSIKLYTAEEGSLATWITGPEHALELIEKFAGLKLSSSMLENFTDTPSWAASGAQLKISPLGASCGSTMW